MPYKKSFALEEWLGPRRQAIDTLAQAHAELLHIEGPGRPSELGRPVAHGYVLRVVSEFQAFVRDLHDLAAERLVEMSQVKVQYRPMMTAATTNGRFIDRGNADIRSLRDDFRRLGIPNLARQMSVKDPKWDLPKGTPDDSAFYSDLHELRNALAHGNQRQLERLRNRGIRDSVSWARDRLSRLNRVANALDRIVWDHLNATFGAEPW